MMFVVYLYKNDIISISF